MKNSHIRYRSFGAVEMRVLHALWIVAISVAVLQGGLVCGQDFSNRPVRIVTAEAGGTADLVARLLAQGLAAVFGQQGIVDNRGGSFIIPIQVVAKAAPDGHTVLLLSNGIWTLPFMQKVPYDPVRDLASITLAASSPLILVVHPSLPVKTVKDVVALARAQPRALNYSSGPSGTSNHLAAELFKSMAGIDILRIAYKGTAPALNELLAGQVQLMFGNVAPVSPHVKSGRLRALAVTSSARSTLFPELPTMAAAGLPGYEAEALLGVFAPAATPEAAIVRLNQEMARILHRSDVKEKLLNAAVEAIGSPPERLALTMRADIERIGKLIRDAGIRPE